VLIDDGVAVVILLYRWLSPIPDRGRKKMRRVFGKVMDRRCRLLVAGTQLRTRLPLPWFCYRRAL